MKIGNKEQEICKGLWAREQGKDKSAIDYVIIDKKYFATIKGMYIDQNKEYATFEIEKKESGDIKKIYSDHIHSDYSQVYWHVPVIQLLWRPNFGTVWVRYQLGVTVLP